MYHSLIFNCHTQWPSRPGGSYRIASFLREQGWDCEVLEWAPCFTLEELQEFARQRVTSKTLFLGFSCFFCFWDDVLEEFSAWAKKEYPHLKIILGMMGKPSIESKAADYFVYGFGENAMLAIIASLTGNTPGRGISLDPGYLARGKKVVNANDFYPSFPMKSLLIKYEDRDYITPQDWLSVEFSRGCMFECLYCNFPVLGVKGDYTRDADDFNLQLTDAYERFGVTNYYASDETFNDRTDKIIKFADAAEKLPFRPNMSGFVRADLMVSRPQDWEHMQRLGFFGHFYGVESFNHKTAKAIGKGMHPQKLQEGLLKIKDYFKTHDRKLYRGLIALIAGLPYETKESLDASRNWIFENWSEEAVDFTPLEITSDEFADKHSKLSKDWAKWGYRESPNELEKIKNAWVSVMHTTRRMNWENDEMDYNYVRHFCSDAYDNEVTKLAGVHNYFLHAASAAGAKTIEEVIERRSVNIFLDMRTGFMPRLKEYKAKKLRTTVDNIKPLIIKYYNGTYLEPDPWGLGTYDGNMPQ